MAKNETREPIPKMPSAGDLLDEERAVKCDRCLEAVGAWHNIAGQPTWLCDACSLVVGRLHAGGKP